jgi:uncharacterized Rmd1/YagE family protein
MSETLHMRAMLLASRLDTRGLEREDGQSGDPLVMPAGAGRAFLFRNGAAAFTGLSALEEDSLIRGLGARLREPLSRASLEEANIVLRADAEETVLPDGAISVRAVDTPRLVLIAEALSKAAAVNHYEQIIQAALDRIEPFAEQLEREGRAGADLPALNRLMGEALLVQHRVVGRSQVAEKPEILWDNPHLERLYARLEGEYELKERALALEQKLDVLRTTTTVITELIQNNRTRVLEWAIVGLIGFEIVLSVLALFGVGAH